MAYKPSYSKEHVDRHRQMVEERDRELEQNRLENQQSREAYLKRLQAAKDSRSAEEDARLDVLLIPKKNEARRKWLYEHPTLTATDFEKVWPHQRAIFIEEMKEQDRAEVKRNLLTSGEYFGMGGL